MSEDDRAGPGNIVLLCPSCHTRVDKLVDDFPPEVLLALKRRRGDLVASVGGSPKFVSRRAARDAVVASLARSRSVFDTVGPNPEDGSLHSLEAAEKWSEAVLEVIVPEHQFVVAVVASNPELATSQDQAIAQQLSLHVRDLLRKHSNMPFDSATRFPQSVDLLFEGESDNR